MGELALWGEQERAGEIMAELRAENVDIHRFEEKLVSDSMTPLTRQGLKNISSPRSDGSS